VRTPTDTTKVVDHDGGSHPLAVACQHRSAVLSDDDTWDDWVCRVAAGERQRLCFHCERWVWESLWPQGSTPLPAS
jgi:hypothetical protein